VCSFYKGVVTSDSTFFTQVKERISNTFFIIIILIIIVIIIIIKLWLKSKFTFTSQSDELFSFDFLFEEDKMDHGHGTHFVPITNKL